MIRYPAFSFAIALCLILFLTGFSPAQRQKQPGERIVMCMIQLEYADAEELAAALEPFLSPEGTIAPYRPTNILIIRDRASVVEKLSTAIKGEPCTPITHPPEAETDLQQEEF